MIMCTQENIQITINKTYSTFQPKGLYQDTHKTTKDDEWKLSQHVSNGNIEMRCGKDRKYIKNVNTCGNETN